MSVILTGTKPPLQEVARLGAKASQIYGILWESALMDVRMDSRKHLPWEHRRDCGGTTSWSKAALAEYIGSKRETVAKAIDKLLDEGFLTVIGLADSQKGKKHLVFRVIHPDDLEAHRHTISMFDEKPSVRWKKYLTYNTTAHSTAIRWQDEPDDYSDTWDDSVNT